MTTEAIIRKVRELEIKSKKITRHLFTGEYHSAFKGRGMLFKEVREYQHGDDIRFIDWNVSARYGHTYSKLFEEERELQVMLLVDVSASSLFGTTTSRKRDLINEIAAVLAFSAISNNDKVGMILFSDQVEQVIPARKNRDHVLYIVRQLLTESVARRGTDLNEALRKFNNTTPHNCILFVLSDFLDKGFEDALKVAGKKHDLIGIKVYDPMDKQLPDVGLLEVMDAEKNIHQWIDTSDYSTRERYEEAFFSHTAWCKEIFQRSGCDLLHIQTDEDYVKVLQRFFIGRNKG
ncbi:MAG: hypothetical protein RL732_1251 [Bacteroidota bacterium]